MKKTVSFILAAALISALLAAPAYADVAGNVVLIVSLGVPLLIIAVLIIAAALIIKAIRNRKK